MSLTNQWCIALVHKLGRPMMVGFLSIIVVCSAISGCGNGDSIVTPTEPEVVEVTEDTEETVQVVTQYDGESIYFKIGNTIYEGSVVEGVSADEVLVELVEGGTKVINVDHIGGTLIADHPDIGVKVKLLGDIDKGESTLTGKITAGYTDDTRKITIHLVEFMGGGFERLDMRPIRFVSKNTDFEDGGYLTLDEFKDWINNN